MSFTRGFSIWREEYGQSEIEMPIVLAEDDFVLSFGVDTKDPDSVLSFFCVEGLEMFGRFQTESGNCQISDGHQTVHPECLMVEDVPGQLLWVC